MTAIEDTLPEPTADVDRGELVGVVDELADMNSDDWTTFVENGVSANSEVRVEFEFSAPHEAAATSLAEDLESEGGYVVRAGEPSGDYDDWSVKGQTPGVTITERGLDEWVRRLAAYGLDHDGCVLDGWAALLD